MSSHSKSFVHSLVRSLTKLEKAHIKRQIKKNEQHLLQLLEDLYKTEVCSNRHFVKKNSAKSYTKNLTQNKNYLRQKIISGLVQYNLKHSAEIEKRNLLNIITVLIEKGFLKKAKELIDDVLLFSNKYQDYTTCYDLSIVIRKIYSSNIIYSLPLEEINKYAEARRFYLKQLNHYETIAGLNDIHFSSIKENEKIKAIKAYLKKIKFDKVEALPEDYPYAAKRIFYFTKSELSRLNNDRKTRNFYIRKTFKLLQDYPQFIERDFFGYLVDSINYLNCFLGTGEYNTFFVEHKKIINQIEKLDKVDTTTKDNYRLHIVQYLFPQNAYNYDAQLENALNFAKDYKRFIEKNSNNLSEHFLATSVTQIAIAYLYNQKFEAALDIIEPCSKIKIHQHQYTLRVLQILCHYFLKNDMLMSHLFSSFNHYLKTAEKKVLSKGINALKKAMTHKKIDSIGNKQFENFFYLRWDVLSDINKKIFKL